jgi:hypothetical protein
MDDQRTDRELGGTLSFIVEKLRTAAIILALSVAGMLLLTPLFPRPRYDYVMDRYYRLVAAAVIGAVAGIGTEWIVRARLKRHKK